MSAQFDVLLSDLNIGQPGDGFTVVSAMRRSQPACITLILTGYPGFDTALEAIRNQVDDYLIKPAAIPTLINLIEQKLQNPQSGKVGATSRISQVLRENVFEITQRALGEMKSDPALRAVPITDEQRIEFLPHTLEKLAAMLESGGPAQLTENAISSAKMHGAKRYQHGYTVTLLAVHARLLEEAIYEVIHEHLRSLNLSYLMFDMKRLNSLLGIQLEHTLLAFLSVEQRVGRSVER
jgi:YesN/AraC family two-component response regulator